MTTQETAQDIYARQIARHNGSMVRMLEDMIKDGYTISDAATPEMDYGYLLMETNLGDGWTGFALAYVEIETSASITVAMRNARTETEAAAVRNAMLHQMAERNRLDLDGADVPF